ncbi:MAG TPA: TetR/AcrR family transcriptional regulator [Rhizomicrobium sp.]|nr:TetR/AcrR family transcriptional regulator [Rhizomicrobium sp.]HWC64320.1 TetR/AcrR family transcriptional regulator [Rhizomicrobium sp.]
MRTGRPRSFCVEEALDRAMTVFWRQGYEGASLSALTAAMGINSPSLYACFGSKEGLFKAVVDRYEARRDRFMAEVLAAPNAQQVAEAFLYGVAEFAAHTGGQNPPGCLMIQGALSCCEEQISKDMTRRRAEKEAALKARFEQARKTGDLPKTANPATLARYLAAMANGICVQAASGASAKELREVAALALAGWPGGESKPVAKKAKTREPV